MIVRFNFLIGYDCRSSVLTILFVPDVMPGCAFLMCYLYQLWACACCIFSPYQIQYIYVFSILYGLISIGAFRYCNIEGGVVEGDVVPEGNDMATMETNYGLGRNSQSDTTQETLNKLFVHDMQYPNYPTFSATGTIIRNADGSALDYATNFVFVRLMWNYRVTVKVRTSIPA